MNPFRMKEDPHEHHFLSFNPTTNEHRPNEGAVPYLQQSSDKTSFQSSRPLSTPPPPPLPPSWWILLNFRLKLGQLLIIEVVSPLHLIMATGDGGWGLFEMPFPQYLAPSIVNRGGHSFNGWPAEGKEEESAVRKDRNSWRSWWRSSPRRVHSIWSTYMTWPAITISSVYNDLMVVQGGEKRRRTLSFSSGMFFLCIPLDSPSIIIIC